MVWRDHAAGEKPAQLRPFPPMEREEVLPPNLAAVRRLSDGCGILQHGLYRVPNRDHGYCVGDNARALILMHQISGEMAAEADALATTHASFVQSDRKSTRLNSRY